MGSLGGHLNTVCLLNILMIYSVEKIAFTHYRISGNIGGELNLAV